MPSRTRGEPLKLVIIRAAASLVQIRIWPEDLSESLCQVSPVLATGRRSFKGHRGGCSNCNSQIKRAQPVFREVGRTRSSIKDLSSALPRFRGYRPISKDPKYSGNDSREISQPGEAGTDRPARVDDLRPRWSRPGRRTAGSRADRGKVAPRIGSRRDPAG